MYIFGTRLQSWRHSHGYTQERMADFLNVSRRTVASWELGKKLPGYDSIINAAVHMGVSADWLLGIEDKHLPTHFDA